jgi:type I restriction enzyme M protein
MDYWAETMQDDVYLIAADGWVEAARPRGIVEDKERKIKETPDLTVGRKKYKMDLVPPALLVARYFAREQAALEALQGVQETAARALEEFVEEHASAGDGEEGLLAEATNDKGKVTKGGVKDRLKAIEAEPDSDEERDALTRCLALIEAESKAGTAVKDAQAALDAKVLARYAKLTEAEIKTLVVEDKWLASIRAAIEGEVERLTQRLAGRVRELEERYGTPLPALAQQVETFSAKVERLVCSTQ